MPLLNSGVSALAGLATGLGSPAYDNTHAYIGIGDGTAGFNVSQTDLQASSNKTYLPMDIGYPTISTPSITFEATFGTNAANYDWNEWVVLNGSNGTAGTALNRKVENLGTKPNTQIWVLSVTLTFSTP
jgi:hypothetical protein